MAVLVIHLVKLRTAKHKWIRKERRKYPSLHSFTWSEDSEKSEGQFLVENTVQDWYDAKHATSSIFEIEFINSLDIKQYPFCGSNGFIKYDHKKMEHKDIFVKNVVNA